MNVNSNELSNNEKNMIFGVDEVSKSDVESMDLRYKVEIGNYGDPDYICQQVLRDNEGNYFLLVDSDTEAPFSFWNCHLCGRNLLIPIRPEALIIWAESNLHGDEYELAMNELKGASEIYEHKPVWRYEQGRFYESLWKITDDLFMLYSTDGRYPYPSYSALFKEFGKDGICRDDIYFYYISPATARRLAECRGIPYVW